MWDLNYKDRLSLLKLPYLEERRVSGDLIETFKLLKGIAKPDYCILFKLSVDYTVREHTFKIVKNSFCLNVRKNFFSNRVWDAWNELPQYVVDAETVNSFEARLDKFHHKMLIEQSYAKNIQTFKGWLSTS